MPSLHAGVVEPFKSFPMQIREFEVGLAHIWILHTSASLTVSENADPTVRVDMNAALDRIVPDDGVDGVKYLHDDEGADDMPAHVKCSLMGAGLTMPITRGGSDLYTATSPGGGSNQSL